MDDDFYRNVIAGCSKRIGELQSLHSKVSIYTSRRSILDLLNTYRYEDAEALSVCCDNVLLWNCLLHALQMISTPLIPFELIHGRTIDFELLSAILTLLPSQNMPLIESVLSVMQYILFGENSGEDEKEERDTDDSQVATLFPLLITSIGYSLCRPVYSSFMSITHKQGFEEIGALLTLLLDNKKWFFYEGTINPEVGGNESFSRSPSPIAYTLMEDEYVENVSGNGNGRDNEMVEKEAKEEDHSSSSSSSTTTTTTTTTTLHAPNRRTISAIMQSGMLTTEPDIAKTFGEALQKHFQIAAYSQYGTLPLIPRPTEASQGKAMIAEELFDLQTVALGTRRMHTSSLVIAMAGRKNDVMYNSRTDAALRLLQDRMENLAVLLLQTVIRRKNCQYVYKTQMSNAITLLPKRSPCCLWCRRPKRSTLEYDFSSFFEESEWMESTASLLTKPREERLLYLQRLQLQLAEVEKRLPSNEKLAFIEADPYLLAKYAYYQRVLLLFTNCR